MGGIVRSLARHIFVLLPQTLMLLIQTALTGKQIMFAQIQSPVSFLYAIFNRVLLLLL